MSPPVPNGRPRGVRRAFRAPWRRGAAEVDEEFAFHIDMRAAELAARGWAPAAARQEALRQFGDVDDARAYCRIVDERRERRHMRTAILDAIRQDVRLAVRGLRASPGFTLVALLTLALGVGANVTMLGIVDRLLLRPPAHVRAPDQVRRLYVGVRRGGEVRTAAQLAYPQLRALRADVHSAAIAAYHASEFPIGDGDAAHMAKVTLVTADFLPLLGARPALGRFFTPGEDALPAGARVAVISHALWQREFGGAASAVGGRLTIAGQRFDVVGVAPPGLTGVSLDRVDVWVPVAALGAEIVAGIDAGPWYEAKRLAWLRAVVRLRAPDDAPRVAAELTAGVRREMAGRVGVARADALAPVATLEPLLAERGPDRTPAARIAVWLAAMSVVVLLVACANVANLLLARGHHRRRELAVRASLGASRGRLASQLLTESMLLALVGGVGAVAIARWGGSVMRDILVPGMAWESALDDRRLLALAALAATVTGVLTGLVPAVQASGVRLVGALRTGAREGGGHRGRTRESLVVAQAALSLVLLVGAGLFVRSLHSARAVPLGFAPERVLVVDLDLRSAGYTSARTTAAYDALRERLARLPGARDAAIGMTEPFASSIDAEIRLPGRDSLVLPTGDPWVNAVSPEYFATMGTPLRRGRGFTDADRPGAPIAMVVNETMARTLWAGRDALGETVCLPEQPGKPCATVVGVVADARWDDLRGPQPLQMYVPIAQSPFPYDFRVAYLRAAGEPEALAAAIRREARAVAPGVAFTVVRPLARNLEPELRPWRLGATVFTAFGALALVLAALGLYGVIAYDVARRMREMGVRVALGARPGRVLRLVVGEGVRVAALGVALGVVVALAAARWVGPLLFDTRPYDPTVVGGVAVALLVVAAAACLVPAWRATRVAPAAALRAE